ncbi:uncharacterized protein J3R85_005872 [Psidium guajava]|nr:uncharacterized protein J3R85_005872 [Psidium guajava]
MPKRSRAFMNIPKVMTHLNAKIELVFFNDSLRRDLKSKEKSSRLAKDVDSILPIKFALRVTSTQYLAESLVLDASSSDFNGESYRFHEYLVRKSPMKATRLESLPMVHSRPTTRIYSGTLLIASHRGSRYLHALTATNATGNQKIHGKFRSISIMIQP